MVSELSYKAAHHGIFFASFVIAIKLYDWTLKWVQTGIISQYVSQNWLQIGITYVLLYVAAFYALPKLLGAAYRAVFYR